MIERKQYLIIGAGKFGYSLAKRLQDLNQEVMIIDKDESVVQKLSNEIDYIVEGDVNNEAVLEEIGAHNFDVVIISVGTDVQTSIMVALTLKEMGVKKIVAKATNDLHAKVLYRIGATRVVFPEQEMGYRVAQNLVNRNVLDFVHLSLDYTMVEIDVPVEWYGRSVLDIDIRKNYNLNIVAIKNDVDINIAISPNTVFHKGDTALVIGLKSDAQKLSDA